MNDKKTYKITYNLGLAYRGTLPSVKVIGTFAQAKRFAPIYASRKHIACLSMIIGEVAS